MTFSVELAITKTKTFLNDYLKKKGTSSAMNFPSFRRELPYRFYCEKRLCFIQKNSMSVGWLMQPFAGMDEAMLKNFHHIVQNKCSDSDILEFYLISSNQVASQLKRGVANPSVSDWTLASAKHGFSNAAQIPAHCRDYQLVCFLSSPSKGTDEELDQFVEKRRVLESEFQAMQLHHERMSIDGFLNLMAMIFSFSPAVVKTQSRSFQSHLMLNEQLLPVDFELIQEKTQLKKIHQGHETTVQVLGIDQYPAELAIWDMPDTFAPIAAVRKGINCPFLITWQLKRLSEKNCEAFTQRNFKKTKKKANSDARNYVAGLHKQADQWHVVREGLQAGDFTLVKMHYQVVLFSLPKKARSDLTSVQSLFRAQGIELSPLPYLQLPSFLMSLPMVSGTGLWADFERAGRLKLLPSWQAIQFAPLLADLKLGNKGMLLPSFRHQLCFFDPFDERLPITNFNIAVAGTAGAGKSFWVQSMLKHVLEESGVCFVIDMGQSYRKFCEHMGGVYLSVENLKLNPFTGISNLNESIEGIRDLFAVLASPNEPLSSVQQQYLLDAIREAFNKKGQYTQVDDVVEALNGRYDEKTDVRLDELVTLLTNYTKNGSYQSIFNEASPLGGDNRLIVLELGELDQMPQLLKAVLLALILAIEKTIYHSDRNLKKLVVIDEAWRLLGDNSIAARPIEKGYRTARRHRASFVAITQGIDDFLKGAEAKACWNNSSIKLILKQDSKGFETFRQENPNYFSPSQASIIQQFGEAKRQGFSECCLQLGSLYSFHRLFVDPFSKILFSSHAKEFEAVKALQAKGLSLNDAIFEVAKYYYGNEFHTVDKVG